MSDLIERASAWLADDPDPSTRADTAAMIAGADEATLEEHFGDRLQFGTAGLRGELGAGPNRMNRALVRRVSAGLADYVRSTGGTSAVVGYDGRHGSLSFAQDTARVLAGRGLKVWLYDRVAPTPELAWAVTRLAVDVGVMVTASHNPPQDNGYKVYWSNGAQIIAPHDTGISAAIDRIADLSGVDTPDLDHLLDEARVSLVPAKVRADYLLAVAELRVHPDTKAHVVYTAMHGVGADLIRAVFAGTAHTLELVPAQAEPDPDFPTVAFPNPEEPGATDLALAQAKLSGAQVILANDPDADRLAVVARHRGDWVSLTGNQIGALLADDLLRYGPPRPHPLVATTIVSSQLLSRIAASHGASYAETLTGFKWIANRAITHDAAGGTFIFGYEEAIGFSAGPVVRDKDGVSAAVLFADLVGHCARGSETVVDRLDALYAEHGCYGSSQKALTLPGAEGRATIERTMATLRAAPPTSIGGSEVIRLVDVQLGISTDTTTGTSEPLDLPRSNVLAFTLADGGRVLARPSGTEPKIKFYFEARVDVDGDIADARARAKVRLAELTADLSATLGL